jgi:hypothetical protein
MLTEGKVTMEARMQLLLGWAWPLLVDRASDPGVKAREKVRSHLEGLEEERLLHLAPDLTSHAIFRSFTSTKSNCNPSITLPEITHGYEPYLPIYRCGSINLHEE